MRDRARTFFVRWWWVVIVLGVVCLVEWLASTGAMPSGVPLCPWWFGVVCG